MDKREFFMGCIVGAIDTSGYSDIPCLSIQKIYDSKLIDFLSEIFNPKCIVLFGSFSKGEYDKTSDIDIFLQAEEKTYDLSKHEKKLKHTINLFFESDLTKISNELFNNIINGIKLAGYIKVK